MKTIVIYKNSYIRGGADMNEGYTIYVEPEKLTNNKIFAQHAKTGEERKLVSVPYMVLIYAAHGKGVFAAKYFEHNIAEGDIILVRSDTIHRVYTTPQMGGLSIYFCVFEEKLLFNEVVRNKSEFERLNTFFDGTVGYLRTMDTKNKDIRDLFVKIIDEFYYTKGGHIEAIHALLSVMLIYVLRLANMEYRGEIYLQSNNTLGDIINYINKNLSGKLALSDTAKVMHVTPQYVCRVFRRCMGMTYTDYVNKKRVDMIKDELENTDRPLFNIYDDFELSHSYLNELFKKYAGCSMKEYKKRFNYKSDNPLYSSRNTD